MLRVKDRDTGKVRFQVSESTDKQTVSTFGRSATKKGSKLYTDEARAHLGMVDLYHESLKHSMPEYVRHDVQWHRELLIDSEKDAQGYELLDEP